MQSIESLALKGEKQLQKELDALRESNIRRISSNTKKRARETVESLQPEVEETIQELQVRMELLRNIRLNWENFQRDAADRGLDLRLNQLKGLHELITFLTNSSAHHAGAHRGLMGYYVQPTGAGKTGLFSIEAKLADVPTLILVPFDNLLDQTKVDLCAIGGFSSDDIGIVGGGIKEVGRRVTVATYAGHAALMKKNKSYRNHVQQECKLVICDEVHMALGERTHSSVLEIDGIANGTPTEQEVSDMDAEQDAIEHMESITPTKAVKIGFTATPKLSAKHVEKYFPHLIGRIHMADLIEAGVLVPYKIVQADGSVYAGEIETYITEKQEVSILQREGIYRKLLGEYASALLAYQKEKHVSDISLRGMAFCTNLVECDKFLEQATSLGIRAEIITGREAKGKSGREVIISAKERMVSGEIDLIITVEKLCAGFNFPEVNAIIWARITSMAKTIQGVGRGGRSFADNDGRIKEHCTVFETDWSLKDSDKKGRVPLRFADALAQNGEDPERICTMKNGNKLSFAKSLSMETICGEVLKEFTPETWSSLKHLERKKLTIANLSLWTIAKYFEIDGDPVNNLKDHLKLGRAIFGQHELLQDVTSVVLIEKIKEQYSPQDWAKLSKEDKTNIKIRGLSIKAISSRLGFKGNIFIHKNFLDLGCLIFGEQDVFKVADLSVDNLTNEIRNRFSAEEWSKMTMEEKRNLKICGIGLKRIASTLGIMGNPVGNKAPFLALGRKIFGEIALFVEHDSSPEIIKSLIIRSYTAEQWATMKKTDKQNVNINGMRLFAIAGVLGIKGDPVGYHSLHLQLGRVIFGEVDVLIEPDAKYISNKVKKNFSIEQWSVMKYEEKKAIKFNGLALNAIARLFDVEGNPLADHSVHLMLGRIIFGNHPAFDAAEKRQRKSK